SLCPSLANPQGRQKLDGSGQEPLQERRSLLGQRPCHAGFPAWPGGGISIGTPCGQRRAGGPCRGTLRTPARRPVTCCATPATPLAGHAPEFASRTAERQRQPDRPVLRRTLGG